MNIYIYIYTYIYIYRERERETCIYQTCAENESRFETRCSKVLKNYVERVLRLVVILSTDRRKVEDPGLASQPCPLGGLEVNCL